MKISNALATIVLGTGLIPTVASSNNVLQGLVKTSPLQELRELNLCKADYESKESNDDNSIGTFRCPSLIEGQRIEWDPTCSSCIKESSISDLQRVLKKYSHPASREARLHMLEAHFDDTCSTKEDTCEKPVVVVSADDASLPALRRWWCHAQRNGLDRNSVIVFTRGLEVTRWAGDNELYSIHPVLYGIQGPSANMQYALYPLFLDLLQMGKAVLYNDVNVLWTSNMAERLDPMLSIVDLVGQASGLYDGNRLQSSVLLMNPTREVVDFFLSMLSIAPLLLDTFGSSKDQVIWDNMMSHEKFSSLNWLVLPSPIIVIGDDNNEFVLDETLAVYLDADDNRWDGGFTDGCTPIVRFSPSETAM